MNWTKHILPTFIVILLGVLGYGIILSGSEVGMFVIRFVMTIIVAIFFIMFYTGAFNNE